jgi:nitroreductase
VLLPLELSGSETAQVLHYAVQNHGLEHRAQLTSEQWQHFTAHSWPHAAALVLLSTLDWREIWKYGERAWRYVQLDVGHALAALQFAARVHGWSVVPVTSVTGATLMTDAQVCTLFGLSDARPESSTSAGGPTLGHCAELEHERPAVLLALIPHVIDVSEYLTAVNKLELDWSAVAQVPYQGNASQASWMHHHWHSITAIDHVTRITQRTRKLIEASDKYPHVQQSALSVADERMAGEILRTRRSALEYLPQGGVTWPQLRYMLAHLLNHQVWQSTDQSWGRHIHCALYIHRVEGKHDPRVTQHVFTSSHMQDWCQATTCCRAPSLPSISCAPSQPMHSGAVLSARVMSPICRCTCCTQRGECADRCLTRVTDP